MDEHTTKEDRLGGGPMVDTAPGSRWRKAHIPRIIRCLLLVNTLDIYGPAEDEPAHTPLRCSRWPPVLVSFGIARLPAW